MSTDDPGKMARVQPVSARLPNDVKALLDAEAARQGCGITELLREGVLLRLALAMAAGDASTAALLDAVRELDRALR